MFCFLRGLFFSLNVPIFQFFKVCSSRQTHNRAQSMSYYPWNNGAHFSYHIFTAFLSFPSCLTWSALLPTTTCRKENSSSGYANASRLFSCMDTHVHTPDADTCACTHKGLVLSCGSAGAN